MSEPLTVQEATDRLAEAIRASDAYLAYGALRATVMADETNRALLKEYGYDGDMPTDKQMQVIGNGLLEYWGVSDGFKEALASTMENMFGVKAKD